MGIHLTQVRPNTLPRAAHRRPSRHKIWWLPESHGYPSCRIMGYKELWALKAILQERNGEGMRRESRKIVSRAAVSSYRLKSG